MLNFCASSFAELEKYLGKTAPDLSLHEQTRPHKIDRKSKCFVSLDLWIDIDPLLIFFMISETVF